MRQQHGHGTQGCFRSPRCVKCAGAHHTRECVKSKDTPAKCVNCEGDHPASSLKCPTYIKKLKDINDKRGVQTQQLAKQAPELPTQNRVSFPNPPWTTTDPITSGTPTQEFQSSTKTTPAEATANQHDLAKLQIEVTGHKKQISQIQEIISDCKAINEMCDIAEVLRSVKKVKSALATCNTHTKSKSWHSSNASSQKILTHHRRM